MRYLASSLLVFTLTLTLANAATPKRFKSCAHGLRKQKEPAVKIDARILRETVAIEIHGELEWDHAAWLLVLADTPELGLKANDEILVVTPGESHRLYHVGGMPSTTYRGLPVRPINLKAAGIGIDQRLEGRIAKNRTFELFGRVPTTEEFKALNAQNRRERRQLKAIGTRRQFDEASPRLRTAVADGYSGNPGLSVQEDVRLAQLSGKDRQFAKNMQDWIIDNIAMEPKLNDRYAIVGSPEFTFTLVRGVDGLLLGGRTIVRIQGVTYEGDQAHFSSMRQALKAGADDNDVQWETSIVFDYNLNKLSGEDYLTWSGH